MDSESRNKILVIDDDQSMRFLLRFLLGRSGYEVDQAENGDSGLMRLRKERYDIILSDVNMPGMDGLRLYTRIKEDMPGLKNRVLFITGDTSIRTHAFFTENECNFLYKPFKAAELLGEVGMMLKKGENNHAGEADLSRL